MRETRPSFGAARTIVLAALCVATAGCVSWFFSGEPTVDRSQPVAVVQTTEGVEHAATTEFGVLFLGRTATEGPCRVHYYLGPTPMVEDGTIDAPEAARTLADEATEMYRSAAEGARDDLQRIRDEARAVTDELTKQLREARESLSG